MDVRAASQTKSHHQAALQSVPRQSLRRLDRPGKNETLDGPRRGHAVLRSRNRRTRRRPLPLGHCDRRTAKSTTSAASYREVVANEKLVFTWAWKTTPERESLVTVLLKPDGDGTLLTLTHEQFADEDSPRPPPARLERRAR